ncbi:MAG: hemerythrin domain-containing protein [Planctomycetota bacterium]
MCSTHNQSGTESPMQVLKNEHRVIEKVLDAMERQVDGPIDREFYTQSIDFLRNFADGCHHAKEEDQLFPILESVGIPRDGGPIGCMLHEHEQGRALIRLIADNLDAAAQGDAGAAKNVRRAASSYIALLRQHIYKEDNVLFVMADEALGPHEQQLMRDAFHRADEATACASRHGQYVTLAEDLSRRSLAGAV